VQATLLDRRSFLAFPRPGGGILVAPISIPSLKFLPKPAGSARCFQSRHSACAADASDIMSKESEVGQGVKTHLPALC